MSTAILNTTEMDEVASRRYAKTRHNTQPLNSTVKSNFSSNSTAKPGGGFIKAVLVPNEDNTYYMGMEANLLYEFSQR